MKSREQTLLEEAYKQVTINELFDTKKKVRWLKPKDDLENFMTSFVAPNGVKYYIQLTPTQWADQEEMSDNFRGSEEDWRGLFHMSGVNQMPASYVLEFYDEDDRIEITGEGMPASVLGIVINAVTDLIKKHSHIKYIIFSAKEPSRRAVYSKIAPMVAKRIGFRLEVSKNKEYYYLCRD